MSYLVLARRFRPQTFQSIVGQEHVTKALAHALVRDRVHHAMLFTGPRGVGKTTSARVLARALNCTGRPLPKLGRAGSGDAAKAADIEATAVQAVEPCGHCSNCLDIARSASMSVWEIDGASNNSVENVRELIDSLRTAPPPGSSYKIYIIDEVHMLSVSAFNALLKSLEEPPPQTIFIFATTEPHKIPETVISRCQRHDFRRISTETISAALQQLAKEDGIAAEEGVFDFIAIKAQGGMRDAQSMLDRLIVFSTGTLELQTARKLFGLVDDEFFYSLSAAVIRGDTEGCLDALDQAFQQSLDIRGFVGDFISHWRNLLVVALSRGREVKDRAVRLDITRPDWERFATLAGNVETFDIQRLFDIAKETADQALHTAFPRYVLEAGLAKMASLPTLRPLGKILAELDRATRQLRSGGSGSAPEAAPANGTVARPLAASSAAAASTNPVSAGRPVRFEVPADLDDELDDYGVSGGTGDNLSWVDFVNYLKNRKEQVLSALLRRVSLQRFSRGILYASATEFEATTLKEAATFQSLKDALAAFTSHPKWDIKIEVLSPAVSRSDAGAQFGAAQVGSATNGGAQRGRPPSPRSGAPGADPTLPGNSASPGRAGAMEGRSNGAPRPGAPLPGSVAALELAQERERLAEIGREAREQPLVKAVLETFEGSTVEVRPLGRSQE